MAHKIWLVLTAIVLWAVGQTVWAQSIELTPEKRQELYDITRKSALTTAQKKINSNSFHILQTNWRQKVSQTA